MTSKAHKTLLKHGPDTCHLAYLLACCGYGWREISRKVFGHPRRARAVPGLVVAWRQCER